MEKFMRKMWKKSEGFTLVELIVVIAILGILAAVAVPAYSGYMTKAKESADMQVLSSVATAVAGVAAADGLEVTSITVTKSNGTIAVEDNNAATGKDVNMTEVWSLLATSATDLAGDFKGSWTTAVMSNGEWTLNYPTN